MGRPRTPLEERMDRYTKVAGTCWVWTGAIDAQGYGRIGVDGRTYRVHRLAYELATGEKIPPNLVVNHRCGVRHCCRPEHLELTTVIQNARYRTVIQATNTSGYRGVHFDPRVSRWQARVYVDGVRRSLGYYETPEEANLAAVAGRAKFYGVPEFADVAAQLEL